MNKDRIAELLAGGFSPVQVASVIGCTPAYISQLKNDDEFKLLVASKEATTIEEDREEETLSARYAATEHALLKHINDSLVGAELRDATNALRVVAERQEKMKLRKAPAPVTPVFQQNIVNLTLPSHVVPRKAIEMTAAREVIAIDNRTLAPLSSDAVTNLFKQMNGGNPDEQATIIASTEESSTQAPVEKQGFLAFAGSKA